MVFRFCWSNFHNFITMEMMFRDETAFMLCFFINKYNSPGLWPTACRVMQSWCLLYWYSLIMAAPGGFGTLSEPASHPRRTRVAPASHPRRAGSLSAERPKTRPRRPKTPPRRPRRFQDASKMPQDGPRPTPRRPKTRPKRPKTHPRRPKTPPRRDFDGFLVPT